MLVKGAATTVDAVALLFAGFGSVCAPATVALVVRTPFVVVESKIVSVAFAPLTILPTVQLKVLPEMEITPCVAFVASTGTLAGRESFTVTPVAELGPRFVTTTR